ncbi:hypothetical protein J2W25_001824 [Variovorax boronicumulans]|uniref:Uncharacterized protein n=1 Tax=Variovorax boronicumulans TaxID=436515 RepID=A0AAW8DTK9_9BURK|nr:hypothetical protein [Variovorax boronicumulans]MDP9877518.1 hypothetical protein [Variovorax boronicumulans]MDP9922803.1 hypothetical protein [Variovorax boronicumulans]
MLPMGGSTPTTPSSPATPETPEASVRVDDSVKVSFDSAAVTMAYQLGDASPGGVVLNAVAEAKSTATLFVSAATPDGAIDPRIDGVDVTVTGMKARIVVKPKAGLSPGVYKGSFIVRACADVDCKVVYAGSPWTIGYTLTVTLPYAALDTSAYGVPRTVAYDALRNAIYASYPTPFIGPGISAVARFRMAGSTWTGSTLSIPGLYDIALPADASVLATTDSNNLVSLIDPSSFTVKSTHLLADGIGHQGSMTETGIAFTNDGKLWLSTGSGYDWHGLGYFDTRTMKFGASTACSSCYGGPFFAVSGDGSRLMVTQSASMSPRPPMLYMDTADGVFRTTPLADDFFVSNTSLSANGDRFLLAGYTVYDRNFGTVGSVPQPVDGTRAIQISPDGRRLYVLSYAVNPGDSALPLVEVYDTSAKAGTQLRLPKVGSFNLADVPGCKTSDYPYFCLHPLMRVTPDGNNLVVLGDLKLIVAPISQQLSGLTTTTPAVAPTP